MAMHRRVPGSGRRRTLRDYPNSHHLSGKEGLALALPHASQIMMQLSGVSDVRDRGAE